MSGILGGLLAALAWWCMSKYSLVDNEVEVNEVEVNVNELVEGDVVNGKD